MSGVVATFYSYKGGVGRTFALANVAALLGSWGFQVLCIDWDIEAPGLPHYFRENAGVNGELQPNTQEPYQVAGGGLVGLLSRFHSHPEESLDWRNAIQAAQRAKNVSILPAGTMSDGYAAAVAALDWKEMYARGLGSALEVSISEMREQFDFVLIDGRTGLSDFAGVIAAQLPDILVFFFTANDQSLEGSVRVARRAAKLRNEIALARPKLALLPIPARFEIQLEHSISREWREKYQQELAPFYGDWLDQFADVRRIIEALTVPYVPYWSFGERLAVLEESLTDPLSISRSLENLAALLAHRLGSTTLLAENREDFVASARRQSLRHASERTDFFVSSTVESKGPATRIAQALRLLGASVFVSEDSASPDDLGWRSELETLARATHLIVLLDSDGASGKRQNEQIRSFLRLASSDERSRLVLPVVAVPGNVRLSPILTQYKLHIYRGNPEQTAQSLLSATHRRTVQIAAQSEEDYPDGECLVRVRGPSGPLENADVLAFGPEGLIAKATTGPTGEVRLHLGARARHEFWVAHLGHAAAVLKHSWPSGTLEVNLAEHGGWGSLILSGAGPLPGVSAIITPVREPRGGTYLYAEGWSISSGAVQPVRFAEDQSLQLEDDVGRRIELRIRRFTLGHSLVQFRRLAAQAR